MTAQTQEFTEELRKTEKHPALTMKPSTELWLATGKAGLGISATARVLDGEDAEKLVKWRGPIAAVYRQKWKGKSRAPEACNEEFVAYLRIADLKLLLGIMEPLAGPGDAPLHPPITPHERESMKTQEGPGA